MNAPIASQFLASLPPVSQDSRLREIPYNYYATLAWVFLIWSTP